MVDGFYLIRYFQNAAAFWYFYSALILHTLGADFYAIRLLLFPRFTPALPLPLSSQRHKSLQHCIAFPALHRIIVDAAELLLTSQYC